MPPPAWVTQTNDALVVNWNFRFQFRFESLKREQSFFILTICSIYFCCGILKKGCSTRRIFTRDISIAMKNADWNIWTIWIQHIKSINDATHLRWATYVCNTRNTNHDINERSLLMTNRWLVFRDKPYTVVYNNYVVCVLCSAINSSKYPSC